MSESNTEKKAGFAHAIAYYMKLAYSNWHKELVHDDAIRSEMNNITGGELEFSNTPYIKHRAQNFEREEYDYRSGGRRQNFQNRDRGGRSQGGRDSRDSKDNRGGQNRVAAITAITEGSQRRQ